MPIPKKVLREAARAEAQDKGEPPPSFRATPKSKAFIKQYPPDQWHFELVGLVKGYPASPEVWEARRKRAREQYAKQVAEGNKPRRLGTPNGFAGLRQAVYDARAWRTLEAKKIVQIMENENLIQYPDPSEYESIEDHDAAKGALAFCVSVVRSDTYQPRERLDAARTVLNFTKSKPVQKVENTLLTAESFLDSLASKVAMPTE